VNREERRVKRCGRVDLTIDPNISLPLSGEVPRRGGGGTEGGLWHGVAGKGKRDDTPVHSLPQSRPLADPAPSEREPWVLLSLQAYAKQANAVRPYGSRFTFLPVGNPQTFRREQAPALRCSVYLFARRDAPPGASGKGCLWHDVAGKGNRDDTRVPPAGR